jgi:Undecaprenyl-phosphate glucose phosphotransferase
VVLGLETGMFRRHGNKIGFIFLTNDLMVTLVSWVCAYQIRYLFPAPLGMPSFAECLYALPFVLILATFSYHGCGLYEIHRLHQLPSELATLLRASGLLFVLVITTAFYRRDPYESRIALAMFFGLNLMWLIIARRFLWKLIRWFRKRGFNQGKAIVVGTGRTARKVVNTLQNNPWTGLDAVGYVSAESTKSRKLDLPLLGQIEDLAEIAEKLPADFVFVALSVSNADALKRVQSILGNVAVDVQWVPEIPNLGDLNLRTRTINDMPFVGLRETPHYGWRNTLKRIIDLVFGFTALLIFSPVMTVIALIIRQTSAGPVFYSQERVGLGGKPFQMMKFRTMRTDAEQATGPVWASREDDRCTGIGRFLRKTSLDELPQLFNVLRGEMSLVGPRPERSYFIERFRDTIPHYMLRHAVKSGMTGWAQVHGWRGDTSLRKRIQYDLYYISHWSPWLDLFILWLTLWHGFRNQNAH